MLPNFKVTLLLQESENLYTAKFYEASAKSKSDALLDILIEYAMAGDNLNKVKKTAVRHV